VYVKLQDLIGFEKKSASGGSTPDFSPPCFYREGSGVIAVKLRIQIIDYQHNDMGKK
jgi:hypothetical protein